MATQPQGDDASLRDPSGPPLFALSGNSCYFRSVAVAVERNDLRQPTHRMADGSQGSFRAWSWLRSLCLVVVLMSVAILLLAAVHVTGLASDMRLAIFRFRDTQAAEPGAESVPGLGAQIREKLERYFTEHQSEIPITSKEIVVEILDQKGLDEMGIIDASFLAKLGDIKSFTHFWAGSYTIRGSTIDVEAQLWSLETAEMVLGAHGGLPRFVPEWHNAVEELVCTVFQDMYFQLTDEVLSIRCPRTFPGVGFDAAAQVGLALVRMGAVNNVIREAEEIRDVKMDEFTWIPEVSLRATYAFMPHLEFIASLKYIWGGRDAGASANVTLDISALSLLGGLAYAWEPPGEWGLRFEFDGQVGWSSGSLRKIDVEGELDCPARIVADGFGLDGSARISVEIMEGWSAELVFGVRGMRLPAPSSQVRDLDFGGFTFAVTLNGRLWGD